MEDSAFKGTDVLFQDRLLTSIINRLPAKQNALDSVKRGIRCCKKDKNKELKEF